MIIIYAAFNIAFAVWMLAAYYAAIPRDLEEAARVDGCTKMRGAISVFLPMAIPAIAVAAIVTFGNGWNAFTVALTTLCSPAKQTITLCVVNLVAGRYTVEWNQVMAVTPVATVPVAVLSGWLQRYLVGGLALGAVK